MRYLTLLKRNDNIKPVYIKQIKTSKKSTKSDKKPTKDFHICNKDLYDKHLLLNKLYDTDEKLRKNYPRISKHLHPFDTIGSTIKSKFIPDCPPLKITNAFMKMYEMLEFIDRYLPTTGDLRMFDIAGAPGMFVLGTEYYLAHNERVKNVNLDWQACSLVDKQDALTDLYRLYEFNPNRFTPCNVLNNKDIEKCLTKGKFDLVTGDIGIYHENDYDKLQEELQLDIEWAQMSFGLHLTQKNSIMILKMYTLVMEETHLLLDTLTQFFDNVYLCKPFTSRLINDECYIICLHRNDKDCSSIPLQRQSIKSYVSINKPIIETFETTRTDYKLQMVSLLNRIYDQFPNTVFKNLLRNYQYRIFYNQLKRLNFLFYYINKKKPGESDDVNNDVNKTNSYYKTYNINDILI